jgi:hypothetical protein
MVFDMERKVALKRARLALRRGNLDEACRVLSQTAIRDVKEGQELCYALADALCVRAEEHASCENLPEALLDVNRAMDLGGARPAAVRLRNEVLEKLSPSQRGTPHEDHLSAETRLVPTRSYTLWLDGVGTYFILPFPRISIGRFGSSTRPDVPLPGTLPGTAAEIIRTGEQYLLCPHAAVTVNGKKVAEKVLASGDRMTIGQSPALRFNLPCPMSSTAVVRLDPPSVLPGKAQDVLLLDQFLVIGSKGFSHIKTSFGPRQLVLFLRDGSFWAKTDSALIGAGETMVLGSGKKANDQECPLSFGKRVAIDGLSFTLTEG